MAIGGVKDLHGTSGGSFSDPYINKKYEDVFEIAVFGKIQGMTFTFTDNKVNHNEVKIRGIFCSGITFW